MEGSRGEKQKKEGSPSPPEDQVEDLAPHSKASWEAGSQALWSRGPHSSAGQSVEMENSSTV